ncbi:MAG TPA: transglutaminase family protein [bacterium]|nr:transglutaminase family protein [bacterium]HQL63265.1 transglutaminase family protein [bacterium]
MNRRKSALLVASLGLFLLCSCSHQARNSSLPKTHAPAVSFTRVETLDELLAQPEEEIDIALGALLVERELEPDLDVDHYLKQVNDLAKELGPRIVSCKIPSDQLGKMAEFIFEEKQIGIAHDDPGKGRFLNELLDNGHGNCFGLTLLYLSLGQRLDIPLKMVAVPGHSFAYYDSRKSTIAVVLLQAGETLRENGELDHA